VIDQWLDLIDARFKDETKKEEGPCIAAHCVAGLGRFALCLYFCTINTSNKNNRAPVLVAIALVEAGMDSLDAVAFVRKHRHGAISNKQLRYIEKYKKRSHSSCCIS
jgi:protein tyrosine phosphatase type 4A